MSSTAGAANIAAVVQAVKEAAAEIPFSLPASTGLARSPGKAGKTPVLGNSGYPSPPSSLPTSTVVSGPTLSGSNSNSNIAAAEENLQFPRKTGSLENGSGDSAIAEGYGPDAMKSAGGRRRASEGAHLVLGGAPGGSRARSGSELKCDKCGKGYKHSSCLTKHLFVLPLHLLTRVVVSVIYFFGLVRKNRNYYHCSLLQLITPTPHLIFSFFLGLVRSGLVPTYTYPQLSLHSGYAINDTGNFFFKPIFSPLFPLLLTYAQHSTSPAKTYEK